VLLRAPEVGLTLVLGDGKLFMGVERIACQSKSDLKRR
jgi:hypothetical protein